MVMKMMKKTAIIAKNPRYQAAFKSVEAAKIARQTVPELRYARFHEGSVSVFARYGKVQPVE